LEVVYEGKSKIVYKGETDGTFIIKYKDSATAGNGAKKQEFAGKGAVNAKITKILFELFEQSGIETHYIKTIDETTVLVKKAEIVQVEVIIRNIAAGSFSARYGIPEGKILPFPTVEHSLKSDALNDPLINESHILALELASEKELKEMSEKALKINEIMKDFYKKANLTLVDFKLEFGRFENRIILCDEISPDSCRLWDSKTGQKLDKDIFRRDLGDLMTAYNEVLRRATNV
jgi:phosphoribosylaminoimidazole-succinocarboxamide synthase